MEQSKYQLFDGKDEKFNLVVASNKRIRKVCEVLTQCRTFDNDSRVYYAKHGDISPQEQGDGDLTYSFKNRYDNVTVWPALAEVLFYDFPSLVELEEDGSAFIPDENKEQFDNLIRSEVMRGRDDFLGKFGVTAPEVNNLLKSLANAQIPLNISDLDQVLQNATADRKNTNET